MPYGAALARHNAQARPFRPDGPGGGAAPAPENSRLASIDASQAISPTLVYLPFTAKNWCPPTIEFTYVPPYGSTNDLQGRVGCVVPADYKVAVYIYVSGWWTKPTWAAPLTPIRDDSTWTTDITTGGNDPLATRIAAFLVPNGYNPPPMSGQPSLPAELFSSAVAYIMVERSPLFRQIQFSGRTWNVKAAAAPVGPGPNYFSDSEEDVWVDQDGRLHLTIVHRNNRWYCTEVFTTEPLGYGTYTFTLASPVDELDKNAVLGLFTWDDTAPGYNYRELDIEFSRWGEDEAENAQYVVQPWDHAGNRHRFNMTLQGPYSTHWFTWVSSSVEFWSYQGHAPDLGDEIQHWLYGGGDVPPAGAGNARINLWLLNGVPPSDGQGAEVIIERFEFVPSTP
jgi:hypothetical protein